MMAVIETTFSSKLSLMNFYNSLLHNKISPLMFYKFYSCVILALCFSFFSRAQCNGTITLSSQAEVDAFPSTYGCSNIPGTLQIIDSNDITNLDSLYQLTSVGTLMIERNSLLADIDGLSNLTSTNSLSFMFNPEITSINGFSSLVSVGALNISDSPKLTNLDGFSSLRSANTINIESMAALISIQGLSGLTTLDAPGRIRIIGNAALTSLAGTENFSSIPGHVFISSNNAMTTLDGFTALTYVGGLFITGNANLTAVPGFANLQTVGDASCDCTDPGLDISANPKLANVDGFSSLQSVGNNVEIVANASLANLDGFSHLTSIGRMLLVGSNASLTNLDGLSALTSVGVNVGYNGDQSIDIERNPALTSIRGLRNVGAINGALTILQDLSLVSLDGLQKITRVGGRGVEISENKILVDTDALGALTTIDGNLYIKNNLSLTNVNGFRSLTSTGSFKNLGFVEITGNQSLQNVDSLSSLVSMGGTDKTLYLSSNPKLTKACGIYPLLTYGMGCPSGTSCAHVTINGNGPGVTEQSIRNGGPCQGVHQCSGTITLASQAEVDAFPSKYGCTTIEGTLQIVFTSDVTNLDSLYQLTNVTNLTIAGNSKLKDIDGLSHITQVNILLLQSNDELTNISGLSSLATANQIVITGKKLASLHGLEQLRSVGTLDISFCPLLTDLAPLSGLTRTRGGLSITHNNGLTSLSGLNNITSVDGNMRIEANAVLTNVNGMNNLTSTVLLWVLDNPSLTNVDGFSKVTSAGLLTIKGNPALTNLNGLSSLTTVSTTYIENNAALVSIQGLFRVRKIFGNLYINNNTSLPNLNGLGSLTSIGDVQDEGRLEITGNTALQNVDSLSSLLSLGGTNKYLVLTNNPNLIRGCGLYPLIHNNLGCNSQACTAHITISGNGPGVTEQTIRDGGPCDGSGAEPAQPTNLVFSKVTGVTLRLSFTPPSQPPSGGYLVLMRHHEKPYPEEGPVDGTAYQVGDVIGNSTIVVSTDLETVSDIVWLSPNTPYYFDIFSYTASNHYVIPNYLEGSQVTGDPEPPRNNTLVFSNVTDNTMTVSFVADSTVDGYLTIMRAHNSSYPDEVPEDGVEYNVGNVIGNSTIVVGKGTDNSNDIIWLNPDVDYFFEVLSYKNTNGYFDYDAEHPQSGHQRTNSSTTTMAYPNPFIDNITIPFTVSEENTHVNIVIFDQLGRMVSEVTSQHFPPGKHEVVWDRNDLQGRRVVDGLYMYAIKSTEKNRSGQGMVVAK
jgi:hypothetical protein